MKKGVNYSQVTGKAYGQYFILNKCIDGMVCNDTAHKLNRRVEYKWKQK